MTRVWMLALCALLIAVPVVAAGCGPQPAATTHVGSTPAPTSSPTAGQAETDATTRALPTRLLVSRDFGAEILLDVTAELDTPTSVMALLATNAKVETGYGGGFVGTINGLRSTFATAGPGKAADWFYWVDGRLADIGADYSMLQGGEVVWWDYHVWSGAAMIPTSLSAFPRPFTLQELAWSAPGLTSEVSEWAHANGLTLGTELAPDTVPAGFALLALPLDSLPLPPWLEKLLARGNSGGVFITVADPEPAATSEPAAMPDPAAAAGPQLTALTEAGRTTETLEAAALCLPHPDDPDAVLLVILGVDAPAVRSLLTSLTTSATQARVALGMTADGVLIPLPDNEGSMAVDAS